MKLVGRFFGDFGLYDGFVDLEDLFICCPHTPEIGGFDLVQIEVLVWFGDPYFTICSHLAAMKPTISGVWGQ